MFNLSRQARGENAFGTGLSPAEALRRKVLGSKQIPEKDSDLTLASLRLSYENSLHAATASFSKLTLKPRRSSRTTQRLVTA